MSEVVYQWHPDVVADFRELPEDLRAAYLEQIEAVKTDPKLGEHLDRRASTGDLPRARSATRLPSRSNRDLVLPFSGDEVAIGGRDARCWMSPAASVPG